MADDIDENASRIPESSQQNPVAQDANETSIATSTQPNERWWENAGGHAEVQ